MTTELPLGFADLQVRIRTPKRTMALSSLRPGDWLRGPTELKFCVLINSRKLERAVLWSQTSREEFSFSYEELRSMAYLGHGKPRLWLPLLPYCIAQRFCLYRLP